MCRTFRIETTQLNCQKHQGEDTEGKIKAEHTSMMHKEIAIDQCGFKGFAKSGELIVQVLAAKLEFFPLACI